MRKMGRNTTADLEELLEGFQEERFSGRGRESRNTSAGLDYAQLDAFLDEPSGGGGGGGGGGRFSEKPRGTIHSFVDAMDYCDDDEDEEEEVVVQPKNARPSQSKQSQARPSQKQAPKQEQRATQAETRQQPQPKQQQQQQQHRQSGGGARPKHVNPVPAVGTDARKGPTYPSYKDTPVADARKPRREKAIATPDAKAPDVFLVEKPEDHLESSVYFSGTVSFNDPAAADRFLALLTQLVNQSAVVFHAIRSDNPGAARGLATIIREMRGLLHHFVDSAEEETAKQMCLDSIKVVEEHVQDALGVLDDPPPRGEMWPMHDNQRLADALKKVLSECCLLMKVSEREQAQQFMVVVKTCFDTVENILNSHRRHCGIYFTHLQGYINDHLYPLLDNRIETTPDAELKEQYRNVRTQLKQAHPAFKAFMDGQWPPGAAERAKSAASYDMKREGAMPFIEALQTLEDILKTLLNPVSDFEIRFNLPRKPLEEIAQKLIRASARQDRPAVLEAAKQLQSEMKELPPDDPHVEAMRLSSRDLIQHAKKVLAKEEMPEQMAVAAEALVREAALMEEEQVSRRRSLGPQQDVVEAMARASDRMALIAADPMRVSRVDPQTVARASGSRKAPLQEAEPARISQTHEQRALQTEAARKSAARVSSRASVVVQLAQVRGKSKPKAREHLVEASDRVARALEQLAELETSQDPDLRELERLVELVDQEQAGLFDSLPSPAPSRRSEDTRSSVRKSVSRGTTVVQLYEKQKGDRRPNEKLVVAAEKVAQTLEELTELQDEPGVGEDELQLLVEESSRQQRDLLLLAKDPSNFVADDDFYNEF